MKKTFRTLALVAVLLLGFTFQGEAENVYAKNEDFKVVGYYSGDLFKEDVSNLQTDKLTHIFYAFLIPREDGSLIPLKEEQLLRDVVAKAHGDGAEVYISVGGYYDEGGKLLMYTFEKMAADDSKRANFINNLCDFIDEFNLDGVELDWESPTENTIGDYEKLINELHVRLKEKGKGLTAALGGAWTVTPGKEVNRTPSVECLNKFDFINVMAYDMGVKDHSPLWAVPMSAQYWKNRGLPKEKIVMGVPLYGKPSWIQYRHLVDMDPENAYRDYVKTEPTESWYNGMNTLREKTIMSYQLCGGIMMFDVNEDATGEYSVVNMMDETIKRLNSMSAEEVKNHITIVLNKRELVFQKSEGLGMPYIDENNRTLMPLRKSLEAIGATVTYNGKNKVVSIEKDGVPVKVPIGSNTILVGGQEVEIDSKAVIRPDGRAYIPLRAIYEAYGYEMKWNASSKTVYVEYIAK